LGWDFWLVDVEYGTDFDILLGEGYLLNNDMACTWIILGGGVPTEVGGILWTDTTWSVENSPYVITDTIQVPSGVSLAIEPGVTVARLTAGDMFLIHGTISAKGTADKVITFYGGGNSDFFNVEGSGGGAFLDLEHCIVWDGRSFWWGAGHGHFDVRHSELRDLTYYSHMWYPEGDIHIEYNQFINTGGFSIGLDGDTKAYIQYNLFDTKNLQLPSYADFWVENWASYDSSATIAKYNTFANTNGIALQLPSGYGATAMTATENYWGTEDTDTIDTMIYDRNDDINCASWIDYLPVLTEPHPDAPRARSAP